VIDVFAGREFAQHQIGERTAGVYAYPDLAHAVCGNIQVQLWVWQVSLIAAAYGP
jgi:hypothetical protein